MSGFPQIIFIKPISPPSQIWSFLAVTSAVVIRCLGEVWCAPVCHEPTLQGTWGNCPIVYCYHGPSSEWNLYVQLQAEPLMEPGEIWVSLIPARMRRQHRSYSVFALCRNKPEHSAVSVLWQHRLLSIVYSTSRQLFRYITENDRSNGMSLPFYFCCRVILILP